MPFPVYPKKTIHITSEIQFEKEIKRITDLFKKKESEETWEQFKHALNNLSQWITQDNIHHYATFEQSIKDLKLPIIQSLASPRTILSSAASELLKRTAQAMKSSFATKLNPTFVQAIIKQFGSTNKVHTTRVLNDYKEIIQASKLPKCIPLFTEYLTNKDKHKNNTHLRVCLCECLLVLIQVNSVDHLIKFQVDIEKSIRVASVDSSAQVRLAIRACYAAYAEQLPEQSNQLKESLSENERKHLDISPVPRKSSSSSSLPGHKRTKETKRPVLVRSRSSLPLMTRKLSNSSLNEQPKKKEQPENKDQEQTKESTIQALNIPDTKLELKQDIPTSSVEKKSKKVTIVTTGVKRRHVSLPAPNKKTKALPPMSTALKSRSSLPARTLPPRPSISSSSQPKKLQSITNVVIENPRKRSLDQTPSTSEPPSEPKKLKTKEPTLLHRFGNRQFGPKPLFTKRSHLLKLKKANHQ